MVHRAKGGVTGTETVLAVRDPRLHPGFGTRRPVKVRGDTTAAHEPVLSHLRQWVRPKPSQGVLRGCRGQLLLLHGGLLHVRLHRLLGRGGRATAVDTLPHDTNAKERSVADLPHAAGSQLKSCCRGNKAFQNASRRPQQKLREGERTHLAPKKENLFFLCC